MPTCHFANSEVYSEVGIITDTTTLNVVGGNVGLMIHEFIIVLLAPWIGSYDPNP